MSYHHQNTQRYNGTIEWSGISVQVITTDSIIVAYTAQMTSTVAQSNTGSALLRHVHYTDVYIIILVCWSPPHPIIVKMAAFVSYAFLLLLSILSRCGESFTGSNQVYKLQWPGSHSEVSCFRTWAWRGWLYGAASYSTLKFVRYHTILTVNGGSITVTFYLPTYQSLQWHWAVFWCSSVDLILHSQCCLVSHSRPLSLPPFLQTAVIARHYARLVLSYMPRERFDPFDNYLDI